MHFKLLTLSIPLIFLLSFGCASQRTKVHFEHELLNKSDVEIDKIKDLSFLQVKENIVSNGLKFTSLKAKADITIISPEINGTFRCKGVLRFQKPDKIRVIGSKLARTVFDMLSDGENYWFYLPNQKAVYTGKSNLIRKADSGAYIFPDDIAALLNYDMLFEGRSAFMEIWPASWLIHIFDEKDEGFIPYSRLTVDRIDGNVTELALFNAESFVKVNAVYGDYTEIDGRAIPKAVQINWPETDTTLILILHNLSIDKPLKPEIFHFKKPKKADIIKIN